MRFEILVTLSFLLLALFAIEACAIEEGDSGLSADQLIDVSNGIYDIGPGETPQQARARWDQNSDVANAGSAESKSTDPSSTAPAQAVPAPSETSAAGNWSFGLKDSQNRIMGLTLYQSEGALHGTGTINAINGTETVSASGSLTGDQMALNITSLETGSTYSFSLTKTGNTASGKYLLSQSGGEPVIGTAEGTLLNPAQG
jgi:hypothetical protein